jgi:hypothetical protein
VLKLTLLFRAGHMQAYMQVCESKTKRGVHGVLRQICAKISRHFVKNHPMRVFTSRVDGCCLQSD